MCYGELISQQILVSRGSSPCDDCRQPVPRSAVFVRTKIRESEGCNVTWTLCQSCAVQRQALIEAMGMDHCYYQTKDAGAAMIEEAGLSGWASALQAGSRWFHGLVSRSQLKEAADGQ